MYKYHILSNNAVLTFLLLCALFIQTKGRSCFGGNTVRYDNMIVTFLLSQSLG